MANTKHTPSYVRTATVTPRLFLGDPMKNAEVIVESSKKALSNGASLVLFPELAITGYSMGDLFHNDEIHEKTLQAILTIEKELKDCNATIVIGAPIRVGSYLANCAVVISEGRVAGIVPKLHLPNYKEFYEKRWFTSGYDILDTEINIGGKSVPFGYDIIFTNKENPNIRLGIEICEDIWMAVPPSSLLALSGANILLNLSASNEIVSKASYRRDMVVMQSAKTIAGYLYASCGVHESTTDVVFSGHCIIADNGHIVAESTRFDRGTTITYGDIDMDHIFIDRARTNSFAENNRLLKSSISYRNVLIGLPIYNGSKLLRPVYPTPFLPSDETKRREVTQEIFNIQVAGLARRIESSKAQKVILGLSGGLDSTLALLVCLQAFELLKMDKKNIHTITMPGFGTTSGTKNNAKLLAEHAGVTLEEIPIVPTVTEHFKDIAHNINNEDVVFENSQARYRTMILFDKANQLSGIVIGTGDLSESALGWCTFNGDHISHYNVNCSVPKTLVRYVVEEASKSVDEKLRKILLDVLATPISPELKSAQDDAIIQKTEDLVGPYLLHDFFLYHFIRWGSHPDKILSLATQAFAGKYEIDEIRKWLKVFITRFFKNQWKRSVMADGPKVGSVSLSPRGDWRMPSDLDASTWLEDCK